MSFEEEKELRSETVCLGITGRETSDRCLVLASDQHLNKAPVSDRIQP